MRDAGVLRGIVDLFFIGEAQRIDVGPNGDQWATVLRGTDVSISDDPHSVTTDARLNSGCAQTFGQKS